jgi:hypothetical protein
MPEEVNFAEFWDGDTNVNDTTLPAPSTNIFSFLTYYFTSKEEIERTWSVDGVEDRRDDYDNASEERTKVMYEVIIRATMEVKGILNKLFADVNLVKNPWVREKATYIACYLLSVRRGNPSHYYNEYLDALDALRQLVEGEIYFEDLPVSTNSRVAMVNVSTDNRLPGMPIRVDPITSTDSSSATFLKWYQPYIWI